LLSKIVKLLDGAPIVVHNVSGSVIPDCIQNLPGVEVIDGSQDPVDLLLQEPSLESRRA